MTSDPFIRPAEVSDIDPVCELLHAKMNRKIEPQRWRNLMTYHWLKDKPDFGRVIDHDGQILGYLGLVYADRQINQCNRRVVSMSAWYLDKSVRGLGLGKSIMADATSDESMSYTILTSSKNTLGLLEQVGYVLLDDSRYIWRRCSDQKSPIKTITDVNQIYPEISLHMRKLLDDHAQFPVSPVLAQFQDRQCLLFFSVKQKGEDVTYFDLLYTSDRGFLGEFGQQLANSLLPRGKAVLATDCRFVENQPTDAGIEKLLVPRYFKSTKLKPWDIDHLYCELQLLDLKLD